MRRLCGCNSSGSDKSGLGGVIVRNKPDWVMLISVWVVCFGGSVRLGLYAGVRCRAQTAWLTIKAERVQVAWQGERLTYVGGAGR